MISDDHEDLKSAIERHFQGTSWQRCQVHYARNLLGMVSFGERKELAEGLRGVLDAPSRELALRAAQEELADRWRRSHPKVAEHIEECLSCFWLSRRLISGASVLPTGSRGSTRRYKAYNESGEDLPEQGGVSKVGYGPSRRDFGGVGYGEVLPEYGAAKGAALGRAREGGGDSHAAMRASLLLEEIAETLGLDPDKPS